MSADSPWMGLGRTTPRALVSVTLLVVIWFSGWVVAGVFTETTFNRPYRYDDKVATATAFVAVCLTVGRGLLSLAIILSWKKATVFGPVAIYVDGLIFLCLSFFAFKNAVKRFHDLSLAVSGMNAIVTWIAIRCVTEEREQSSTESKTYHVGSSSST